MVVVMVINRTKLNVNCLKNHGRSKEILKFGYNFLFIVSYFILIFLLFCKDHSMSSQSNEN